MPPSALRVTPPEAVENLCEYLVSIQKPRAADMIAAQVYIRSPNECTMNSIRATPMRAPASGLWALVGTFMGYYGLLDFGLMDARRLTSSMPTATTRQAKEVALFALYSSQPVRILFFFAIINIAVQKNVRANHAEPEFTSTLETAVQK